MENPTPTTTFILDTRRKKAGDVYPVKLRVIYKRQNRLYGTVFDLTKDDFKKVMGEKPRDPYKAIRKKLEAVEDKAIKVINDLRDFTFDSFQEKFTNKLRDPKNVFDTFEEYIAELEDEARIGTAISYKCALTSIKKFHSKEYLEFHEITVPFLKKFENWSTIEGNGLTTVGIYLRCLRAIYNKAIVRKIAQIDEYPFGRGKYEIPSPRNIKKALKLQDIKKIFEYTPTNEVVWFHRDLWIFSYLCNGANIKDICLLKYSDISGDTIIFRRAKTAKTNRNSKPIVAAYSADISPIIERWGNKPIAGDKYIFPVLVPGESEKRVKTIVTQLVKQINKYIKFVAKECTIEAEVTTYTARHSFATVLKRSGVSTSIISESMGHADEKTTENYLGSIEDPERMNIAKNLTNFNV